MLHWSYDKHDVSISLIESWEAFRFLSTILIYVFSTKIVHRCSTVHMEKADIFYTINVYERRVALPKTKMQRTSISVISQLLEASVSEARCSRTEGNAVMSLMLAHYIARHLTLNHLPLSRRLDLCIRRPLGSGAHSCAEETLDRGDDGKAVDDASGKHEARGGGWPACCCIM